MKIKVAPWILLTSLFQNINAQGVWFQLSNFGGGNREISYWFQNGNYGFVGGGRNNGTAYSDLWQYNSTNDSWTQMANKPGGDVYSPGVFVIGDTAFVISGWSGTNIAYHTVWSYIISTNSWSQKNNFPGSARYSAIAYSLNGKGYFGTGYAPYTNDLWEYDPLMDSWSQQPNFPGSARQHGVALTINGKAYYGLGYKNGTSYNDWWEYDPLVGNWVAKTNFPGGGRRGVSYFEMRGKAYLATGFDDINYYSDLWEYDPLSDAWTQLNPNIPVAGRYSGFGFGFNGCVYIGGGSNNGVVSPNELGDVWKYCLPTGLNEGRTQNFNISPNPTTGIVDVFFSNRVNRETSFEIYSNEGRKVFAKQIVQGINKNIFDLNYLEPGIYFYLVKESNLKIGSGKLMVR